MKYDFITIGGAVEDISFQTDQGVIIDNKKDALRQKLLGFEYGAKIKVENLRRFPGGGANNAAVCLSRLGFTVGAILSLGDDEAGKRLIKNLDDNGVDTRLVKIAKNKETGFSLLAIDPEGEHISFVYRGAAEDLAINKIEAHMLNYSSWVYIASLTGEWENVLDKAFSAKNAKIIWNPGLAQLAVGANRLGKWLKKTTILCLNKDEAIELAISEKKYKNKGKDFLRADKELAGALKSFGPQAVIITDGENGADYFDGEIFYHENSLRLPKSKIADTNGVGDTFCASVAGGLEMYQGDFKKALKLGMKNAAANLKEPGAQTGMIIIK